MKTVGRFTAFEEWDATMVETQPEPASFRPDYMDRGVIPHPKPAKQAATPIALVPHKPATSCEPRSRPTHQRTA